MKEIVLSISIAAYNVEKFLGEAVDSIINNDEIRDKIEIIIVNDGSKDNTLSIAKKYEDKCPNSIVVIDKENGGYGSTINSALEIATGKYFKLLDGDDWFNENLSNYVNFLEEQGSDLVLSPYYKIYTEDNRKELIKRHFVDDKGIIDNGEIEYVHAAETAIRTECIKGRINISEHRFYTDTEFAYFISNYCKTIIVFDRPVYCYRIGREGQSISLESRIRNRDDACYVALRLCGEYEQHMKEIDEHILNGAKNQIAIIICFYIYTLLLMKDIKTASKELRSFAGIIVKYPDICNCAISQNIYVKMCITKPRWFNIISIIYRYRHVC